MPDLRERGGAVPDVNTRESKIRKRRLLKEPPPTPEVLALIDRLEASDDFGGLSLEALGEYYRAVLPGRIHGFDPSTPADEPTDALPGSAEKLRVMAERAERGEALFHPSDARLLPHHEEMI